MHGTAHSVPDDLSPPSLRTLSVTIYDATHNAGIGLHLRYMVGRVRLQASLPCPLQPLYKALLSLSTIPVLRAAFTFTVVTQALSRCCSLFVNLNVLTDADLLFSLFVRISPRVILFILRLDINIFSSRTL